MDSLDGVRSRLVGFPREVGREVSSSRSLCSSSSLRSRGSIDAPSSPGEFRRDEGREWRAFRRRVKVHWSVSWQAQSVGPRRVRACRAMLRRVWGG